MPLRRVVNQNSARAIPQVVKTEESFVHVLAGFGTEADE